MSLHYLVNRYSLSSELLETGVSLHHCILLCFYMICLHLCVTLLFKDFGVLHIILSVVRFDNGANSILLLFIRLGINIFATVRALTLWERRPQRFLARSNIRLLDWELRLAVSGILIIEYLSPR